MKIRLVCVGKPRDRELARLHDRFAERVERLGVSYETASVPEVQTTGRFSEDHVREREARSLAGSHDGRGTLIGLDRGGELLTTAQLAPRLENWATPRATLWIGGPLGLHASALERCGPVWSLSPLTFTHEIARLLVAEQIYRALTVLRGVPYHK